jgi:ribose transport system substrate-binding protein
MIDRDPYLIKSVVHAAQLLAAFESPGEVLTQRQILVRTGLSRGIVLRLLYTLRRHHVIEQLGDNQYRSAFRRLAKSGWRIGYGGPGMDTQFTRQVSESLRVAAESCGEIEILALDHRYKTPVPLANAEKFIHEHVDLVIEYQIDVNIGTMMASLYRDAHIPVVAINNPLPGATYFGANNYQAGAIGGRHLGKFAKVHWQGRIDEIIMLELSRAGPVPKTRLTGMVQGIQEILGPGSEKVPVIYLDGDGQFETSLQVMRKSLRPNTGRHVLIGAMNDNSALGALRAYEEAGQSECCVVMGQNGSPESRQELRDPRSRLIGSVAYFPEKYGDGLVRLVLDLLNRRFVAPAVFTPHQLLTSQNVDQFYSNDPILGFAERAK